MTLSIQCFQGDFDEIPALRERMKDLRGYGTLTFAEDAAAQGDPDFVGVGYYKVQAVFHSPDLTEADFSSLVKLLFFKWLERR